MKSRDRSLRCAVEKWAGRDLSQNVRLKRVGPTRLAQWRGVQIDVAGANGTHSILLFRHEDGSWYVFPPTPRRAVIGQLSVTSRPPVYSFASEAATTTV